MSSLLRPLFGASVSSIIRQTGLSCSVSVLRLIFREGKITRDTALLSCVNYENMVKRLGT